MPREHARRWQTNPRDLPFALIYMHDAEQDRAVLAGTAGIATATRPRRKRVALDADAGLAVRRGAADHATRSRRLT